MTIEDVVLNGSKVGDIDWGAIRAVVAKAKVVSTPTGWICPVCKEEQHSPMNWCGKNLKCECCHQVNYYQEWTVKS